MPTPTALDFTGSATEYMHPLSIKTDVGINEYSFWLRYEAEDGDVYGTYVFTVEVCGDEVLTCSDPILRVEEQNTTTPLSLSADYFDS